ncbi:cysteine desulfurase-like protein [Ornithinicoccus halotolerans]|uniref:cysteine desulfurase-like protein n=1 Tax=Ornithinicoccus halotolerans TaxID=1748220 RepID=UPI0012975F67|nr:cysteine desulfurase-like protein [Ornithinicoccus halotolerans]
MALDVPAIRDRFPALAEGAAHFDGPGGSQTPVDVAEAVAATLTSAIANRGLVTTAERRAERIVHEARDAVADLVAGPAEGVVFGRSMTALTMDLARALSRDWAEGDEVVVTSLDHDANIRPWVIAAGRAGATVRWAEFDPATGELDPQAVAAQLSDRTRVVAVTGAANLIGTRPDVPEISRLAHEVGALVHVDGVHLSAHAPVDMARLGADVFACSPYKFCGPHLGVQVGRPELLEQVRPDKLLPATDQVPERFELGTLPYELLAGTTAAVDFLAGLEGTAVGSRRTRLVASVTALEEQEDRLRARIESGLAAVEGLTCYSRAVRRTPTLLFEVEGVASAELSRELAAAGVNAPAGSFYALEASRRLGLGDGGAVRVGLAPYNDDADVDRLLEGVTGAVSRLRG